MKKRQIYIVSIIFLMFSLGIGMEFVFSKDRNLRTYAQNIESSLQKKESKVWEILKDTAYIQRMYRGLGTLTTQEQRDDLELLKDLTNRQFNICLYENDSLVFWTNTNVFLQGEQLSVYAHEEKLTKLQKLKNGHHFLIKENFDFRDSINRYAIALIPVRNNFSLESAHLQNRFITDHKQVPKEIVFSKKETEYPIHTINDETIGWIINDGDFKDKSQLKWILVIYLLGFITLGVLINDIAIALVKKYRPWIGAAFLISVIFGIRYLTVYFEFTNNFSSLQSFSETFSTPVLNSTSSLGDLLINIILLLWMMVFFHREFEVQKFEGVSLPIRYGLTGLNYFSIILGILMITGVFKSLVMDSQIAFDFDNVLNLNFYSFLAILGIILLLIALFLFSHRMMLTIVKIGLNKNQRLLAFMVAMLFSIPVILMTDLNLQPLPILLAAVVFIGAFDLFIDYKSPTMTWLVIWLVLFSAFSSLLLFKYNNDKDFKIRKDYAYELANFRDSLAEESFSTLRPQIDNDKTIRALTFDTSHYTQSELESLIEHHFSGNKYLFNNYIFNLSAFRLKEGQSLINEQKDSLISLQNRYNEARQTAHAGLKFFLESGNYLMRTELPGDYPFVLFLEFKHKQTSQSKVYTELLLDQQYKDLRNLSQYDYAIYKEGLLVSEQGGEYDNVIAEKLPPEGETLNLKNTSERSELLYHAPGGVVVKIGKDNGKYLKPISLFSYLFGMLILAVILLAVINAFTNALPEALHFSFTKTPSLRNRIQFAVIALILVSFAIIGLVSVWHFQQIPEEYHAGRLDRKVGAAETNAAYEIEHRYAISGADLDLSSLVEPLSEIHRLDINVFDLNGNLISSSEEDIFRKGIIAPKMGAHAFQSLAKLGKTREDQEESIGGLEYTSAYIPLNDPNGEVIAYLGLPYYDEQRQLESDVSGFMGALLNVYVFLLLIAGGLAIAVANSITKPISDLGDSLKRLKLGRNEPLKWESKDELGDLIAQYNRMIKKLEESTELLAQSERDSAWREMAKQVAHEIKNPLTPMKLSIQYMLHAYQSNPNNIKPLIERVSKTLIEQIDSLSQIASEFSNFAKMPQAENTKFVLNDLVISVHGLFANERQDMDISLYVPDRIFHVYADKNHLTRVLNNLIKNAIQAIPDERRGRIDLKLSQHDDRILIKVSDNGVGISEEMKEKVFVPNFTTKNSGTGLGLAISKNIIEAFKGKIWFETEEGLGTDFFVELPLIEVEEMQEV